MIYFNEISEFCADWLRNLKFGFVDCRDIKEVNPHEIVSYEQCHFFAGIGGWPAALRLAGWDGPVWTASCPCQPFSCSGKGQGEKDERHLWPVLFTLVSECLPPVLFGEQVASKLGREWFSRVRIDLESLGYFVGAADLPAACIGTPHIRQRLFFGAVLPDADRIRLRPWREGVQGNLFVYSGQLVSDANSQRLERWQKQSSRKKLQAVERGRLPVSNAAGGQLRYREQRLYEGCNEVVYRDGKRRRVPVEPEFQPLAHVIPCRSGDRLEYVITQLGKLGFSPKDSRQILREARRNRVGRISGFGNAIVPHVAAIFIQSFSESLLELFGVSQ